LAGRDWAKAVKAPLQANVESIACMIWRKSRSCGPFRSLPPICSFVEFGIDISMMAMPLIVLLAATASAGLPAALRAVRIDPVKMLRADERGPAPRKVRNGREVLSLGDAFSP
jgi:hypothetical protein